MCFNADLNCDIAVSEDLDREAITCGALLDEIFYSDIATLWVKGVNGCNVNSLIFDASWVLEAAQLRQTHNERQLTAFESCANLVTCTSSLATATCGLTL